MPHTTNGRKVPCLCRRPHCRGALRDYRTMLVHAEKDRHIRNELDVSLHVQIPDDLAHIEGVQDEKEDLGVMVDDPDFGDDGEYVHPLEQVPGWDSPVAPQTEFRRTTPVVGELVMQVLDWWSSNKQTITSSKQVWNYGRSLLPDNTPLPAFKHVMRVLTIHRLNTMETVRACISCTVWCTILIYRALTLHLFHSINNILYSSLLLPAGRGVRQHVYSLRGPCSPNPVAKQKIQEQRPTTMPGLQRKKVSRHQQHTPSDPLLLSQRCCLLWNYLSL